MAMNKKGMMYFAISVFLVLFIVAIHTIRTEKSDLEVSSSIASLSQEYFVIDQIKSEIDRSLTFSSKKALETLYDIATLTLEPEYRFNSLDDMESVFIDLITTGKDGLDPHMIGSSAEHLAEVLNSSFLNQGYYIHVDIEEPQIESYDYLWQEEPFAVRALLEANIEIRKFNYLTQEYDQLYKQNTVFTPNIDISKGEFYDPLYLSWNGTNTIRNTPFEEFIIGGDKTNFQDHVNNKYYLAYEHAPSYLERFYVDMTTYDESVPNPYGIESFMAGDDIFSWVDYEKRRNNVQPYKEDNDFCSEIINLGFHYDRMSTYELNEVSGAC